MHMTSTAERYKFQDLLSLMMQTLTEALNCGQKATAQETLELLIELAGTEPRFLRRQLVDTLGSMIQIGKAESLEEGRKHGCSNVIAGMWNLGLEIQMVAAGMEKSTSSSLFFIPPQGA